MKRFFRVLLALCLTAPVLGFAQTTEEAEAGDVSEVDKDRLGPLRERVRPVSGHVFLKKGRFEFSPSATLSLRDAFYSKYIFGGTLTYHPMETLGVSLRVGYAINTVAGAAQKCTFGDGGEGSTRGCVPPSLDELDGNAPGQIKLLGGADVQWAPIYGKVSLLAEAFVHFDLYGIAGASLVQYRGPGETPGTVAQNYLTPGANLGVGARFFLNRWITLRTELRDLIYVEKGTADSGNYLRNQLLFELGVSFFFGSES
ncbi:outer membrane beta-barrel domain-containing protein [Myxococcus xanthus]|uniref:Outer membrane beta-barrel domain-containing protein n=1 Tax=Myxococcus xanthus TaxID=34 RepID=A0A7Y4IML0_MYXXA|nr:outer membrane beta-barrel domain-containing protein [Myxococcus xanthus]NOJ82013.1 outer membrane beta-barrel domain-containing protein [Myxococcus xanthus]NOJ89526.1 outer membrane beta-barrel domain-containing protein [Myxococcus xanthus]